jgi:hypothetical protein
MDRPTALMHALADGLTGYLTYEARCGSASTYNEYFLYGSIVRIAAHLEWRVEPEWPHGKGKGKKASGGDYQRIDFVFRPKRRDTAEWVALEVKWAPQASASVSAQKDVEKLREARKRFRAKGLRAFLIVAGAAKASANNSTGPKINKKQLAAGATLRFTAYFPAASHTRYGVAVYEVS